jgi:PTH1 family peptidyl-tRNA hydrolase
LGKWTPEEDKALQPRIELCMEVIKGFSTAGLQRTMNDFNNR